MKSVYYQQTTYCNDCVVHLNGKSGILQVRVVNFTSPVSLVQKIVSVMNGTGRVIKRFCSRTLAVSGSGNLISITVSDN